MFVRSDYFCWGGDFMRVGVLGRAHTSSKPLENTVNTVQNFELGETHFFFDLFVPSLHVQCQ